MEQRRSSSQIILISGPGGVGKGTVVRRVMELVSDLRLVVSDTTRLPREGEVHGVAYNFISREEFQRRIRENYYLEWVELPGSGNLYGTPLGGPARLWESGYLPLFEIEVEGAMNVMARFHDVLSIFILAEDGETLRRRLAARGSETAETISGRLHLAKSEVQLADKFRHRLVNRDVEATACQIASLINSCRPAAWLAPKLYESLC